MKINFFEIYIAQRSNLFFSQFTNISRNLIRIRRINGTSLWWNTWKWRETWIVIRRIIRVEGRTRFAFYPSPVTQKEHRIFGIQWAKEHRLSCSTFTHEHEKSVGEREPRHEYSCHWVTTLSSSTKSATRLHAVLRNYRKTKRENVDFILQRFARLLHPMIIQSFCESLRLFAVQTFLRRV